MFEKFRSESLTTILRPSAVATGDLESMAIDPPAAFGPRPRLKTVGVRVGDGKSAVQVGGGAPIVVHHPMTLMSWSSDDQREGPSTTLLTGRNNAWGCPSTQ
jgi:hypothetical protein